MDNIHKRTSRIENFLNMLLTKANITDKLFIGNLPAIIGKEWDEMILIDVLKSTDYDSHADGTANVFLYAKSKDSLSRKPVAELDRMESELDALIAESEDRHYVIEVNWRDSDYDSNTKYYYNIVNLSITIR